jgi:phosphoglycolate phosphatase
MRFKYILFDLDGTLIDSEEGIVKCIQYAISQLGIEEIPYDKLVSLIGPPIQDTFQILFGNKNHSLVDQAVALYRERFSTKGVVEAQLYEGIVPMLSSLNKEDLSLFIATSKPYVFAKRVMARLDMTQYFKEIYGPELDGTRRYKADLIENILKSENIPAEQAVMVGDRSHDIVGANANALRGIGVSWGYGTKEELSEAKAWRICDSIDRLKRLLQGS